MEKPKILAHRGLVTEYQENTIEALDAAILNPFCNGVEFDVFLTKDNKVVLFHDENMKRLTGVDRMINNMTYADLKTIQVLPEIEVKRLANLGVDWIESDNPELVWKDLESL
jgi:glycerophosphoryl diester phosphodiesterase